MKGILYFIRIFVGVLFIFSGLIKVNDPSGLGYKMEEFFDVWGMGFLDDYSLLFAIVMNVFEIVAGVAVIIGWRIRTFSWLLLLLIIFFTFLTGYAMFSGKIKTCGCFGDCIPLTPAMSFTKDLVLTVLIFIIFINRNKIKSSIGNFTGSTVILITTLFCFVAQWYVLRHLPVRDCLAYKKGNNLLEQMKVPAGALPDSFATRFIYKKGNQQYSFVLDSLPQDIDQYTFVDREQKLVRAATGIAPITDFILYGNDGADTTKAVLEQQGQYVILLMKNAAKAESDWSSNATKVASACAEKHIPFYIVTATPDAAQKQLAPGSTIHYLNCDVTVIKTAARVNPTYFVMNGAVIKEKLANADVEKVIAVLGK